MVRMVNTQRGREPYNVYDQRLLDTSRDEAYHHAVDNKNACLADVYARMVEVYDRVNNCFSSSFSLKGCESLTFDVEEYRRRSCHLLSHLPNFDEMQGMYKVAGLWSDLFQTEVELLSNPLLLNKNIAIANKMKHHYLTRERAPLTPVQQLQSSSALSEIQASVLSYNSTKDIPMERSVLNVVNHLLTFNERLSKVCAEDRVFYDNLCDELYAIKESELMRRSPIAAKERNKVLPYLKRLCQSFDTDKCTMHLSTLFFDHYLENLLANGNIDTPPDHNEILRIATATYLLACALREHWTDISSDSYLERASQMVTGAFTPQDIMATQLSILQTMPSGFTSMYTATEYGIFYLSNVKGAYKPQETQPPRPNSARGTPGTGNSMAGTPSTVDDYAVFNSNQRTRSQMSMHDDSDTTILPQTSAENSFESRLVSRSGLDRYSTASMRRQRTASFDSDILMTSPSMNGIDNSGALNDYLLLEMAFRYMVENGGFAFVYHCLIRWDDLYMSRNWNLFIPPSRVAAVLIFHFFVEFFGVDHRKDLLWCRRFCYRVFRMLYDCDVALWYQMFRENIRKWLATVAQSSARLGEMALLLELSGHKFRAAETCLQTFWSRLLFDYTDQGYGIEGLGNLRLRGVLTEADQLLSHD